MKNKKIAVESILTKLKKIDNLTENYLSILSDLATKLGSGWKYVPRNRDFGDEPSIMYEFKPKVFFCIIPSTPEKELTFVIYDLNNERFNLFGKLDISNPSSLNLLKLSTDSFNKAKNVNLNSLDWD